MAAAVAMNVDLDVRPRPTLNAWCGDSPTKQSEPEETEIQAFDQEDVDDDVILPCSVVVFNISSPRGLKGCRSIDSSHFAIGTPADSDSDSSASSPRAGLQTQCPSPACSLDSECWRDPSVAIRKKAQAQLRGRARARDGVGSAGHCVKRSLSSGSTRSCDSDSDSSDDEPETSSPLCMRMLQGEKAPAYEELLQHMLARYNRPVVRRDLDSDFEIGACTSDEEESSSDED